MSNSLKFALGGVALLLVGWGGGYYFAPYKIKTVVVETKAEHKNVKVHKVRTKKPDGTITTTTDTTDTSTSESNKTSSKELTKQKQDWLVGAGVSWKRDYEKAYSVTVQRRIFGNIYVGIEAGTEKSAGLAVTILW